MRLSYLRTVIAATLICTVFYAIGQESYYSQEHKEKVKQLSGMIGNWKGEGWSVDRKTRTKEEFSVEERIEYSLDSTILYMRGLGSSQNEVVHDALGVISVNPEGGYFMTSFLGDGRSGKYQLTKSGENWVWKIPTERGTVVYTITLTEDKWKEEGTFVAGDFSYPFFEMNLKKEP